MKKCCKCNDDKELSEFNNNRYKKSGKQNLCKVCQKNYRELNKGKKYTPASKKDRQEYFQTNKVILLKKQKIYKENNYETIKLYQKEYRRNRRLTDIHFKLSELIRSNISRVFKAIGTSKEVKSFNIVDYTPKQLKEHIENQFKPDMTWDNHGILWELDHRKPIKWFINNRNLYKNDYELCKEANTLSNLQPLLISDNRSKGSSY